MLGSSNNNTKREEQTRTRRRPGCLPRWFRLWSLLTLFRSASVDFLFLLQNKSCPCPVPAFLGNVNNHLQRLKVDWLLEDAEDWHSAHPRRPGHV